MIEQLSSRNDRWRGHPDREVVYAFWDAAGERREFGGPTLNAAYSKAVRVLGRKPKRFKFLFTSIPMPPLPEQPDISKEITLANALAKEWIQRACTPPASSSET